MRSLRSAQIIGEALRNSLVLKTWENPIFNLLLSYTCYYSQAKVAASSELPEGVVQRLVKMRDRSPGRLTKSVRKAGASARPFPSPSSGRYLRARDSACRSLTFILPSLALYTLFSFAWTRPVSVITGQAGKAFSHSDIQPDIPQRHITKPNISVKANVPPSNDLLSEPPSTKTEPTDLFRPSTHRLETYKQERPHCSLGKSRAQSFLMIFMGHSGSSAIMTELKDHPEVLVNRLEPVDHRDYEGNSTKALEFTRQFFDLGIKQGKVPGFKLRPNHIRRNPAEWAALAREYNTRIIWQYRLNTLKQAVGEYSYRYYKDTSILEGLKTEEEVATRCEVGAGCSFKINDVSFFHQLLTHIVRADHLIAQSVQHIDDGRDCVHELRYEDYLYHREGAVQDLFEFLGIEQVKTQPARFKATNDNLCEVVENWPFLCRNFYGCNLWRRHFEDERNGCSCKFSASPWEYCNTQIVAHVTDVVLR